MVECRFCEYTASDTTFILPSTYAFHFQKPRLEIHGILRHKRTRKKHRRREGVPCGARIIHVTHDHTRTLSLSLCPLSRGSFIVTDGLCDQFLFMNIPPKMTNSSTSCMSDELRTPLKNFIAKRILYFLTTV